MVENPQEFYDDYGANEWHRLQTGIDGEIEFEETIRVLDTHLPDSGRILDAGGGAGRYALWLAEQGYNVTVLDLSYRQVEIARQKAIEKHLTSKVSVVQGSITDIGLPDNTYDATCCIGGPLSHLLDEQERIRAVEELHRVSVIDAPVVVSVMGLLGALQLYLTTGSHLEALPELLEHGDLDSGLLEKHGYQMDFTDTHFFRRKELVSLLSMGGISVADVVGLEGLGSLFHDSEIHSRISARSEQEINALKQVIRTLNDDPVVSDLSVHMLAIGKS